ncbi:MAG: homospermidine synthase [Burkholderiales bacterium]
MIEKKYIRFGGRMVIVGCGSVAQGSLPLLLRHLDIEPRQINIITADERGVAEARHFGIRFTISPLTPQNFRQVLEPLLAPGDFLLNLSVDVGSVTLIEFCQQRGVCYLDSCIEPWLGGYTDTSVSPSLRSNYALREAVLALRRQGGAGRATAIPTHGANPGLISHFVKQALINVARDADMDAAPQTREQWARLAMQLGIKVIHCAERDTQIAEPRKRHNEFVNTWSVEGFVGEGCQPAELGWGTHERHFPCDGAHHEFGCDAAIYLQRPGASVRVRSWTPLEGHYQGFLITHSEAISVADYFTVREADRVIYRPTVHYAYHPCDEAVLSLHELAGRNWQVQRETRVLMDEITDGIDELGVLLMGHAKGAYWFGSRLTVHEARKLAPFNNATSLQVAAGVLGGVVYAMENPQAGIIEPDDMPFERILEIARPYLGELVGAYGDWTPLEERGALFPEDVDCDDPWQFRNFRVV